MAKIKPFKAIRPAKGLEHKIAALPYDVYNRQEAKEEVTKEPLSFLKIDRAETQFPDDQNMYADCIYEKAKETLEQMIESQQFITEEKTCFYIYEQVMNGRSQTGIAAVASVDDYLNNHIKKHENTREDKEIDRIKHVDTCNAQTGPIFLAYRKNQIIHQIIENYKQTKPIYHFTSKDGITHILWIVDAHEDVRMIEEAFQTIDAIYIADGHHRCASAVKVCLKRRKEQPDFTGDESFNFFLSVLFADEQLLIMDYNRVVKTLNGLTSAQYLERIKQCFDVSVRGKNPVKPSKKGTFGMFFEGQWYELKINETITNNPVDDLDVSILQNKLLQPILGINDPKTDHNIDFIGGIRGMEELEKRCKEDCIVAFSMYPTTISELFQVADANLLMPPKSTWFEPKLRSGLLIHRISQ